MLLLGFSMFASQYAFAQGFVQNKGQWQGDFDFRLQRDYNYVYFKPNELSFLLYDVKQEHHHDNPFPGHSKGHVYKIELLNANAQVVPEYEGPFKTRLNFLLGNNANYWRTGVQQFTAVTYKNVYPNIDLRYTLQSNAAYKYEFILHPGANPKHIKLRYSGQDTLGLVNGTLVIQTSVSTVVEGAPLSFLQGRGETVKSEYHLQGNTLSFKLGEYPKHETLVIDPNLVFSTYSGSTSDNWGFTATPSANGDAYGGGIVYNPGAASSYPTTVGAFQDTFSGGVSDVTISKYNGDGSQQLYATYLGGSRDDAPFSILEGPNKSLIILGATASHNFPVSPNAYDTTFNGGPRARVFYYGQNDTMGIDMFLTVLDSTGSNLSASTFLGGTGTDGVNDKMVFNYGDFNRGDLAVDTLGNIYMISNTQSSDIQSTGSAFQSVFGGDQDGYVASFNPDLSQLNWATFVGSTGNEVFYSLTLSPDNRLYISGARDTGSTFTVTVPNAYQANAKGGVEAVLMELNATNGALKNFTFTGTPQNDISYFTDVDRLGNVYAFGHSYGSFPIIGNVYQDTGSSQFLQRFSADLSSSDRATVFGSGDSGQVNISPTALLVDDCGNVYTSGFMNSRQQANVNVPRSNFVRLSDNRLTLKNPYKSSTDGLDFYFFVLDASWKEVVFASYFGASGGAWDHVDGGTSRFREDGKIYQAVCAGCGGRNNFPTTNSAYSRLNNSSNCNMAVVKFDFEANQVNAVAVLAPGETDSTCIPYTSTFVDSSYNADIFIAYYPDGRIDTTTSGSVTITDTGYQEVQFLAIDTNCSIVDSTSLRFFGIDSALQADFTDNIDSCYLEGQTVRFTNQSTPGSSYHWYFGDGDSSNFPNPSHQFAAGTYVVSLVASNLLCDLHDTLRKTYIVRKQISQANLTFEHEPCQPNVPAVFKVDGSGFHEFEWRLNGAVVSHSPDSVALLLNENKTYQLELEIQDTLCGQRAVLTEEIQGYGTEGNIQFPNVFTPNGDGLNDSFGPLGNFPELHFDSYALQIYNRWGVPVFSSASADKRWNGKIEGKPAAETVYYYVFNYLDICGRGEEIKGFIHLNR